jgi:hypothetical protein
MVMAPSGHLGNAVEEEDEPDDTTTIHFPDGEVDGKDGNMQRLAHTKAPWNLPTND